MSIISLYGLSILAIYIHVHADVCYWEYLIIFYRFCQVQLSPAICIIVHLPSWSIFVQSVSWTVRMARGHLLLALIAVFSFHLFCPPVQYTLLVKVCTT